MTRFRPDRAAIVAERIDVIYRDVLDPIERFRLVEAMVRDEFHANAQEAVAELRQEKE
jgi:hypothetical protein